MTTDKIQSMSIRSITLLAAMLLAVAGCSALDRQGSIARVDPPVRPQFDPSLIHKGQQLAAVGNCSSCHTLRDGQPYAGGVPLHTPFGTIHGTNIKPGSAPGPKPRFPALCAKAFHATATCSIRLFPTITSRI